MLTSHIESTRLEYDSERTRVRAALQGQARRQAWPVHRGEASIVDLDDYEIRENGLVELMCERLKRQLEIQHLEARLHELQCTRDLQQTLRHGERDLRGHTRPHSAADSARQLIRSIHAQARQDAQRLAQLEDEWGALRSTCARALHARIRAKVSSRRCEELRAQLAAQPREAEATLRALSDRHAEVLQQLERVAEADAALQPLFNSMADVVPQIKSFEPALVEVDQLVAGFTAAEQLHHQRRAQEAESAHKATQRAQDALAAADTTFAALPDAAAAAFEHREQQLLGLSRDLENQRVEKQRLHAQIAQSQSEIPELQRRLAEARTARAKIKTRPSTVANAAAIANLAKPASKEAAEEGRAESEARQLTAQERVRLDYLRNKHGSHVAVNMQRMQQSTANRCGSNE